MGLGGVGGSEEGLEEGLREEVKGEIKRMREEIKKEEIKKEEGKKEEIRKGLRSVEEGGEWSLEEKKEKRLRIKRLKKRLKKREKKGVVEEWGIGRRRLWRLMEGLERYERIRRVDWIEEVLDLEFLGRRVMGRYWGRMSIGERVEYLKIFGELIRGVWYPRLRYYFSRGRYEIEGEGIKRSGWGLELRVVEVIVEGLDFRVIFLEEGGVWILFDLEVSGYSLVEHYRDDIEGIMCEGVGIGRLLEVMRGKLGVR